ncbi:uncharacterized protein GGS22DRAFT_169621 [Annulohypoxylon maeteangense]|uniref:uncharacterized protein n=1 Tax=Annulohypoxylon maeteangense TaxID=1927788 RepID=UPI0020081F2D|nr:uncharacterized protein GGS22DRAFT_169621 [Annulohypoxylon maeteangense]KAI0882508.1 hypothetical protein GGS22DRAFT_169621 [Annulohypoxylon maeteangense]
MAIPWGTIKSLLIFFGPMLLPKAISYYRSARAAPAATGIPIQPIPPAALRALIILSTTALVLLVRALPIFAPENIFLRTQSRLQIPTDVLFNRLASLRPNGILTTVDTALRAKFVNLESRLLYLQHGPDVLASCPFCTSDDPRSYLYYALPAILTPHLVNLVIVSLATSDLIAGSHGPKWRTTAAIAAGLGSALDAYLASSYNYQANSRATRLSDLEFFFWTARSARLILLSLSDGILATLLYLSSTNRAFAAPPGAAERVEAVTRRLASAKSRLNAVGIVKNTALRDEDLRARTQAYWHHEGRLMREVMEEREVVEGVNDALENRINIQDIMRDADAYALNVLPKMEQVVQESVVG